MNTEISFGERYYSYDAVQAEFSFDATDDGVTTDDRGTSVWWDAQRSVSADDVPSYYNDFFDAERYYAIDTVVAKEVPQQYTIGDDEYTFVKPNDELRKAVWSLDGKPYTLTHPSDGAVRSTDEIHGFWGQPRHNDAEKQSEATLYFPTHDSDAREFVANNDNVSVGFVNTLVASEQDDVHAEQTDIYYDHVASVKQGRCSDEDGCGLQGFAQTDGAEYVSASTTPVAEMGGMVQDSTTNDSADTKDTITMQCNDCGETNDGLNLGVSDFGVRKVREENDAVDAELASKEDRIDELETELEDSSDATELLSAVESRVCGDDADVDGDTLLSELESLQDSYEDIQEEMESYKTDERDELLSELKERTDSKHHDSFEKDDDETVTDHIDRLEDKLATVKMVSGDSSPTTVTPDRSTTTDSGDSEFDSSVGAKVSGEQFADFSDF